MKRVPGQLIETLHVFFFHLTRNLLQIEQIFVTLSPNSSDNSQRILVNYFTSPLIGGVTDCRPIPYHSYYSKIP